MFFFFFKGYKKNARKDAPENLPCKKIMPLKTEKAELTAFSICEGIETFHRRYWGSAAAPAFRSIEAIAP